MYAFNISLIYSTCHAHHTILYLIPRQDYALRISPLNSFFPHDTLTLSNLSCLPSFASPSFEQQNETLDIAFFVVFIRRMIRLCFMVITCSCSVLPRDDYICASIPSRSRPRLLFSFLTRASSRCYTVFASFSKNYAYRTFY